MLKIYCGEDIATARKNFLDQRRIYQDKGFEIIALTKETLFDLPKGLTESIGLFSENKVFFIENVLAKKNPRNILKQYETSASTIIILYDEKAPARDIKRYFPKAQIINCKLPYSVFKLLDALFPSQLNTAISYLEKVINKNNETLIFYMIRGRIRDLILIKGDGKLPRLAPWQLSKLKKQASFWEEKKLILFYDNLYRIEKNIKTSSGVYTIKESLELLISFHL